MKLEDDQAGRVAYAWRTRPFIQSHRGMLFERFLLGSPLIGAGFLLSLSLSLSLPCTLLLLIYPC